MSTDPTDALAAVTTALPGGGEARPGQVQMARAVSDAIDTGRHLLIQAGTGTGKSLAYLVPALLSGKRVVVATATKALQDQLAGKDLPFLGAHLPAGFDFAVLKGRSNYVCRQRLDEVGGESAGQLQIEGFSNARADQIAQIRRWAATTATGDRAELAFEPTAGTWSAVSVGVRECPGAARCPRGQDCFAESARRRAGAARLVVVNQHLLGIDLALGNSFLPEHDVVIVDEAHQLEDIVAAAAGVEIGSARIEAFGRVLKGILAEQSIHDDLDRAASRLEEALKPLAGTRVRRPLGEALDHAVNFARDRVERANNALGKIDNDKASDDVKARKLRALQAALALMNDLDSLLNFSAASHVAWVEGSTPALHLAPIDIAALLRESLWSQHTTVLTSATLPVNLAARLGLDDCGHTALDVGSPFDYDHAALLYCATSLPDPRSSDYRAAVGREIESLIVAAGGRTLALFTSWRAMNEAVDALRPRLPWAVLAQGDEPKAALLDKFIGDESTSLFATMSFWQGVDVPGRSLSLVIIDRIPFPRPDDPVLEARRELVGANAFAEIDVPRAAMLLAQGAGRLIRTADDRGVVAVLDPRLARNRSYRWAIINALPPMRRTAKRDEALEFLRQLRDQ